MRLTTGQALVRFLANQFSERDGRERRLIDGVWGIFGHGNVAGIGQALLQYPDELPYFLARNEQAMVHTAAAYAKMNDRLATYACTSSIGPGATNMVTGAALATVNRLPVLLLPGDTFATRVADPVLQQLEDPRQGDVSVNDALRPVSKYFDRIERPEQLIPAALAAMRVLTDPVETGAVTLCLPQDVQAEAFDWPEDFFRRRVWHVGRPQPEPDALTRAVALLRQAERPLIVAGGGVVYAQAWPQLREFAEATGIPVADTHAGKGAIPWDHPCAVGGLGSTGTSAANALAAEADVVLGIGTRYSDFTTASRTVFAHPQVRFVNLNVARLDAVKHAAEPLVADARAGLEALTRKLADWRTDEAYRARVRELAADWRWATDHAYHLGHGPLPAQTEILGALNELLDDRDVVINAAGSMPGDLQALWRARDPKAYHVEYAYSCMGYEIAAGVGAKLAAPDREVVVLVGDGSYLMMCQELVTAVSEGLKLTVVLVDNGGFASIGALSESLGSQRFGTRYRFRDEKTGRLDGGVLPVDLAANAASLGARVLSAGSVPEFRAALLEARAADRTTVVHVTTDYLSPGPPSSAWWDVPVAEVAELDSTRQAHASYETAKRAQRPYL
ncbi:MULTISPECIES: 3D-(3,5/4)-trihydroxycyclohexane-1,2-dione acylhydrolase (decyclizing) [unclassified Streptomyces]|uniref:3D-(3,5/4)-trihydroxycyclohexane-1,2-dione acylhydrolase (decyclizing) n=1 Tax=unclassified Streptomyces TaxID=2593676 RepID=UPI002DD7AE57|nr:MULTISPECIES: 3D-(3,5/4)-trihydroxycyclohexane-1,2-dione acylhydrolase (decyclizing) [unclassified Streptomyces]WSF81802.1 3D-(3,5/4)-trihydroxycyclohexane-1,2-dione acylhydrolase (decyclizing) [Streptomyces sp. NBC_01744]WSC34170.1 3D-(3,5/4)-trihydroxycyclohexane-1,2-dione acylhydrolase (decyclizing) [Streptomyces sp. NBC_01763]WSC41888.1 3D-(3,5/4)-trihydroxycyclohexane-1,2-dione acylhydrolase (decyclizing) [Streptomyces sp. NBC_01763]WSC42597.1 3D-(3,5/4)-trihydroxycyclohexane-1,2-dione 